MRKMTEKQKSFYENAIQVSKAEIDLLNEEIQKELAAVKERITKLNSEIKAVRQIYEGACAVIGAEPEPEARIDLPKADTEELEDKDEDSDEENYTLEEELIEGDDEDLGY